jgi:hypothetical protein
VAMYCEQFAAVGLTFGQQHPSPSGPPDSTPGPHAAGAAARPTATMDARTNPMNLIYIGLPFWALRTPYQIPCPDKRALPPSAVCRRAVCTAADVQARGTITWTDSVPGTPPPAAVGRASQGRRTRSAWVAKIDGRSEVRTLRPPAAWRGRVSLDSRGEIRSARADRARRGSARATPRRAGARTFPPGRRAARRSRPRTRGGRTMTAILDPRRARRGPDGDRAPPRRAPLTSRSLCDVAPQVPFQPSPPRRSRFAADGPSCGPS